MVIVQLRIIDKDGAICIEEKVGPGSPDYTPAEKNLGIFFLDKFKENVETWMKEISDAPVVQADSEEEVEAKLKEVKEGDNPGFPMSFPAGEKEQMKASGDLEAFIDALPDAAAKCIKARVENIGKTFGASLQFGKLYRQ